MFETDFYFQKNEEREITLDYSRKETEPWFDKCTTLFYQFLKDNGGTLKAVDFTKGIKYFRSAQDRSKCQIRSVVSSIHLKNLAFSGPFFFEI